MRVTKTGILLFALVALLAALPVQAAEKTEFTATVYFDPYNVLGNGAAGSFAEFGTISCPGHQPTGDPFQPCPVGSQVNYRGLVAIVTTISSSDSRFDGVQTIEYNANLDATGEGHYWGKWRIDLPDGGVWEGSYSGQISDGGLLAIGNGGLQGTGGSVDGCLLRGGYVAIYQVKGFAFTGTYTGYILDPHAKQ